MEHEPEPEVESSAGGDDCGEVSPNGSSLGRPSPHFTPPTPSTPTVTPAATGTATPSIPEETASGMLPPWETGLDVNAVALALQDSSNTTPVAAAAMLAAGGGGGGVDSDNDHGVSGGTDSAAVAAVSSSDPVAPPQLEAAATPLQPQENSNDPLVAMLAEMGFPTDRATYAVAVTGGMDVQLAMNWLLEHADEPLPSSPLTAPSAGGATGAVHQHQEQQVKMVIVVRRDLGMGKGKIAAQCAHAAVDLYRQLSRHGQTQQVQSLLLQQWEANGEPKIVVGVDSAQELLELVSRASSLTGAVPSGATAAASSATQTSAVGVASTIISDAGRTQVAAGSVTVAAFLGRKSEVDAVTGHLKLL